MVKPQIFFGYASTPELNREALFLAAESITDTGLAEGKPWETLGVSGRVIIEKVLDAIDESELAAFDVSTLNENVLFELGYAIARGKRIWLLLDETDREAKAHWRQFRLLSTVGFHGWANSDDIRNAFLAGKYSVIP
jgi:nucleoside 2-deoxyribosyltransferase